MTGLLCLTVQHSTLQATNRFLAKKGVCCWWHFLRSLDPKTAWYVHFEIFIPHVKHTNRQDDSSRYYDALHSWPKKSYKVLKANTGLKCFTGCSVAAHFYTENHGHSSLSGHLQSQVLFLSSVIDFIFKGYSMMRQLLLLLLPLVCVVCLTTGGYLSLCWSVCLPACLPVCLSDCLPAISPTILSLSSSSRQWWWQQQQQQYLINLANTK